MVKKLTNMPAKKKKITAFSVIGLYLNDYSARFYLREIASLLGKPHQTIKPYAEALVKERILSKVERKKITEYSLNLKNKRTYDYLVIAEKEKLGERLEIDVLLRALFEKLSAFFREDTFVIFGSSAVKIEKNSDIDLLIIGKKDITKEAGEFEQIYNKKLHKIQVAEIEKLSPVFARELYKKHLILNNTEKIINFFGELYETNKLV